MTTTITLDMTSGPVDVRITRLHRTGDVIIQAVRGGNLLGTASGEIPRINDALRERIGSRGEDRTHHIGVVLLTPEQAERVMEAARDTPSEEPSLSAQRARLVADLSQVRGEIEAAREHAADSEDGLEGYWTGGQAARLKEREDAAERALRAFDGEHPEIGKQVAADRRAADRAAVLRALDS